MSSGSAADFLPPVLTRLARRRRSPVKFEGPYDSWGAAELDSSGYGDEGILDAVLSAALKVKDGEAAFERDSQVFQNPEYVWPTLAGLLWAAARTNGVLNVLDFGGSLASFYFQHRTFVDGLHTVRWNVVEQPHFVHAGREHIEDATLRFYTSIQECLDDTQPNVLLASSVLQYIEHPHMILRQLAEVADILVLDRTPFVDTEGDLFCRQVVTDVIYSASYPMRAFSRRQFDKSVSRFLKPIAVFASEVDPNIYKVGRHRVSYEGRVYNAVRD